VARLPFTRRPRTISGGVRLAARGLAAGRVALGAALVAAPDTLTRAWLGSATAEDPGRQIAVRGLGARDVVLGVGALVALRPGGEVRQAARWLEAGVVADLADAAATALADDLEASRAPVALGALGAAMFGFALRTRMR
jgi:hypothetical protein